VARIVVVGSAAQDDVVWLSQPLREGHHVDASRRKLRLGGGGANVAIPLRHAGHQVQLLAPIGADPAGEWILAQLEAAGIDTGAITRAPGESTHSLVLVDSEGERTVVNLHRCREPHVPDRLRPLAADAVYVRSRELDLAGPLAERNADALVIAHVPPLAAGCRPAAVLIGSEPDLTPEFLADPWAAGRLIAGEALRWVVITRGPLGALAYGPGEQLAEPAPAVEVVDTTGAGDVFAAGLVHALVEGRAMADALRVAVAWGAESVRCSGLPDEDAIRRLA
jgi:sugar/nucleoside kinase (ribokinase family)